VPNPTLEEHLPSPIVARLCGVKTRTLAQWRWQKRGPSGWFHITKRLVVYPKSAVEAFLRGCEKKTQAGKTGVAIPCPPSSSTNLTSNTERCSRPDRARASVKQRRTAL
jgi:hypothetical protein